MSKQKREYAGKFRHYRARYSDGSVYNMGGCTLSYIEMDGKVYGACAFCSPYDNFNHQYGRNKADGRLVSLIRNPELADDDLYFIRKGSLADFFRVFDTYMADDLEYSYNGQQKAEEAKQARPQAAAA